MCKILNIEENDNFYQILDEMRTVADKNYTELINSNILDNIQNFHKQQYKTNKTDLINYFKSQAKEFGDLQEYMIKSCIEEQIKLWTTYGNVNIEDINGDRKSVPGNIGFNDNYIFSSISNNERQLRNLLSKRMESYRKDSFFPIKFTGITEQNIKDKIEVDNTIKAGETQRIGPDSSVNTFFDAPESQYQATQEVDKLIGLIQKKRQ